MIYKTKNTLRMGGGINGRIIRVLSLANKTEWRTSSSSSSKIF